MPAHPRSIISSPSLNPTPRVVLCVVNEGLCSLRGMLVPVIRQCVTIQGSRLLGKSVCAPCHQARQTRCTATRRCKSQHQRLQRVNANSRSTMSTTAEDGSSTKSARAEAAPPAEAQSDAMTKAAKDQADADAPTEEDRLQTIKDRMFWTHGSQVSSSHRAIMMVASYYNKHLTGRLAAGNR